MEPVHWMRIVFDFVFVSFVFVFFLYFSFFAIPFNSSFNCADYHKINLPFKNSTVTTAHLYIICLALPFFTFLITEIMRYLYFRFALSSNNRTHKLKDQKQQKKNIFYPYFKTSQTLKRSKSSFYNHHQNDMIERIPTFYYIIKFTNHKQINIPEELGNIYINFGSYLVGLLATSVLTEFIKVIIGRLRPNFLDVCQPDRQIFDLCHSNQTSLVPEISFKCLNNDKLQIQESRKSFPSGHASISFYSMIFLILFLHHACKSKRLGLLPRCIQFFLFMLALYATITRSIDNKHHVEDIVAGIILGTLISCLTFFFSTDLFKKNIFKKHYKKSKYKIEDDNKQNKSNFMLVNNPTGSNSDIVKSKKIKKNNITTDLNELETELPSISHIDRENLIVINEIDNISLSNKKAFDENNKVHSDKLGIIRIIRMRVNLE